MVHIRGAGHAWREALKVVQAMSVASENEARPTMSTAPRKAEEVISLKVTLRGMRPPIWRRLEVPIRMSLDLLHDAIQAAMGWKDHHLYRVRHCRAQLWQPLPG
jgi:hypothetical protein